MSKKIISLAFVLILLVTFNVSAMAYSESYIEDHIKGHFAEQEYSTLGTTYTVYEFAYWISYEVTSQETFDVEEDIIVEISAEFADTGLGSEPDLEFILQKKGLLGWSDYSTRTIPVDGDVHSYAWYNVSPGKYRFILRKPYNDGYIIQNVGYPSETCIFKYR